MTLLFLGQVLCQLLSKNHDGVIRPDKKSVHGYKSNCSWKETHTIEKTCLETISILINFIAPNFPIDMVKTLEKRLFQMFFLKLPRMFVLNQLEKMKKKIATLLVSL